DHRRGDRPAAARTASPAPRPEPGPCPVVLRPLPVLPRVGQHLPALSGPAARLPLALRLNRISENGSGRPLGRPFRDSASLAQAPRETGFDFRVSRVIIFTVIRWSVVTDHSSRFRFPSSAFSQSPDKFGLDARTLRSETLRPCDFQ